MSARENLANAVADWCADALPRLGLEQQKAWEAMLAGQADVRVVVRLREGSICLDAIDDAHGRYVELHREWVAPLRVEGDQAPAAPEVH
jgi:hypothetical protein